MDSHFKKMDFTIKHWAPFPRRFPSAFPVINANFLQRKKEWVRARFSTCNFSLILRGRGEYRRFGKAWPVQAPCVITQWPGEYLEYGPLTPDKTWDELHIDYDESLLAKFQQCGLIDLDYPVWPVANPALAIAQITELELMSKSSTPELVVDRVDRICERLVLETWLIPAVTVSNGEAIHAVLDKVRRQLDKPLDLELEAAKRGMSIATFRRRWAKISDVSPARYLQQLRMREACRLLVETNQAIGEIARVVGFDDAYYFSRRFRKEFQMPPRNYRKIYQIRNVAPMMPRDSALT